MSTNSQNNRSVSDNIRSSVWKCLGRESSQNVLVSPLVQTIYALSAEKRNSRLLQSAIAINRVASKDNFTASQDQINDFAAAVNIIAEKRGIKPQNNGKFTDNQLKNELAPTEVMKYFAAQTLLDSNDETSARNQIETDISSVYGSDTPPEKISNLKNTPVYASDEDFFNMDEASQNNYLSSRDIAEQIRLNDLLKQKKSYPDGINKDDIGEFKGLMNNPDWGHEKDDNFKIEQGDIIEYLMKEVILASAAWTANKASGFVGILSYEIISSVHHNAVKPAWNKTKENFKKIFEHEEKPNEIFTHFSNTYNHNTEAYERSITAHESEDPRKNKLYNYFQKLITNQAIIDDDKIYEMTGEHDGKYKQFSEISSTSDIKENLIQFRDHQRNEQLQYLLQQHPDKAQEVRQWFKERIAWEEDKTKTLGHPTKPNPGNAFIKDLETIRDTQLAALALFPIKNRFEAQMNLFAEHYGAYKFLEMSRLDPKNEALQADNSYKEFIKQAQSEAKFIFLTAAKKRSNGEKILSPEAMIEEAKKLAQASKDNLDHERSGEVKDTKLITIVDEGIVNTEKNSSLMIEYAKAPQTQYAEAMFSIEQREKEQGGPHPELDKRRKQLESIRNHLQNTTPNLNLAKKYHDIKGGRS